MAQIVVICLAFRFARCPSERSSRLPATHALIRGQKLNPNILFSNFSGASGISRQNPGISRQKSLIPWVSRDIPNFLAPTPSRGRPPPHRKISGLKNLGLGSFFVPEILPSVARWSNIGSTLAVAGSSGGTCWGCLARVGEGVSGCESGQNSCSKSHSLYFLPDSCVSLRLPRGVRQAVGCVTQVGLADSGCTLRMGLPSCSEQRARNGTP